MKHGWVYMMTNRKGGVLYIGVTSDLASRVYAHKQGAVAGFTQKYRCKRLVWFEYFENLHDARRREVQMKEWRRDWKIELIEKANPGWTDLFDQLV